jgi:hypothetical protein
MQPLELRDTVRFSVRLMKLEFWNVVFPLASLFRWKDGMEKLVNLILHGKLHYTEIELEVSL